MTKTMNFGELDAEFEKITLARTRATAEASLIRLLRHYPDLNISFGRGKIFWRARLCGDQGFDNERELSYPPAHISRVGRLNDPGSPCLYLSADPETAFSEIGAQLGNHVHLAGFRVLADKEIRLAAIGEFSHVKKAGYIRITGVDPNKTVARIINGFKDDEGLKVLYLDSYFASLLADPYAKEREYLLSRALSALIYRRAPSSVGMFYPSVQLPLGLNLALLPKAADNLIHGVVSAVVRITRVLRFGYFDYEVVRTATGVDDDGRYVWQIPESPKHLAVFRLSEEEYRQGLNSRRTLLDLPAHQAIPRKHRLLARFLNRLRR